MDRVGRKQPKAGRRSAAGLLQPDRTGGDGAGLPETKEGGEETMRLTWGEYLDYEDPVWQERKAYLEEIRQRFSKEAAGFDTAELLDYLEQLEELLRYYTFVRDFQSLEPLMRYYEPLLGILEGRGTDTAGYWYLEMEYGRVNGLLYLDQGNNRKAAEHFRQTLDRSRHCFACLGREEGQYSEKQRLYLAWACAECANEAAGAYERLLEAGEGYRILMGILPILEYVENCGGDTGITEKTAELYFRIGSMSYQNGDIGNGETCYGKGESIYHRLAVTRDSDYYRAKKLWAQSNHGIDAFVHGGDSRVMLACEREIRQFLEGDVWGYNRALVMGALAVVCRQQSVALWQSGDADDALRKSQEGVKLFDGALEILEAESRVQDKSAARNALAEISAQLYSSRVAALEVLGIQCYQRDQKEEAGEKLERVLAYLADAGRYHIPEGPALLLRAESCEYLALMAAENGDVQRVEFYAAQAMEFGERAAKVNGNPAAWELVVLSAALAADGMRDRQKAGKFAGQGLAACEELAKLSPDSGMLDMRRNLEKWKKKADRTGFFRF